MKSIALPQDAIRLLEAMNEGQVTVDSHSYSLPQPFLVIATQNRWSTTALILARIAIGSFPDAGAYGISDGSQKREILRSEAGTAQLERLEPVLTGADVLEMQEAVTQVRVDESLVGYVLAIVRATEILSICRWECRSRVQMLYARTGDGVSRWPQFLRSGGFQAAGGGCVCSQGRSEWALLFLSEKI